ncbi:MAG: flagellar biosynthetic protein FliR [Alphaproteobacteria bacterium]|nr:flagellar biosynthetic protein FliR [Alphaproteobacteria bacterium]
MWEKLVGIELYHFLYAFSRIGAAFLCMPFFAATYFSKRIRMIFVITLTVAVVPSLSNYIPVQIPSNTVELFRQILIEVTVGLFIGLIPSVLMATLEMVGFNAAMATSFASATVLDPQTNIQSTVLTTFLSMLAIMTVLATNMHHMIIGTILNSYEVFPVGQNLITGDLSEFFTKTVSAVFDYGFRISSPFILMIIVLYTSMGVMSRLMPQLNIMFIIMPFQVYLGLTLFMITLPLMIWWFMRFFDNQLSVWYGGPF